MTRYNNSTIVHHLCWCRHTLDSHLLSKLGARIQRNTTNLSCRKMRLLTHTLNVTQVWIATTQQTRYARLLK